MPDYASSAECILLAESAWEISADWIRGVPVDRLPLHLLPVPVLVHRSEVGVAEYGVHFHEATPAAQVALKSTSPIAPASLVADGDRVQG